MKSILKHGSLLVMILLSFSLVVISYAQDESVFEGVWFIEEANLVIHVNANVVEVLSPGPDGCTLAMELELSDPEVLYNGAVLFTLELAEDGKHVLLYEDGELNAVARWIDSLDEACHLGLLETSVETITSLDDVEKLVQEVYDQTRIPGMAVAIVGPQGVIWSEGYGFANVETGQSITPDTPFMLASVTKVFTGTSLLQAWEEKGFDLDTPVNDWLPFQVDNPKTEGEVITLRHLATHTSGLLDNWEYYLDVYTDSGDSPIVLGDFLQGYLVPGGEWYDAENNFADWMPGTTSKYANVGAGLAGYMMEMLTGTSLDDYADAHLFGPLGMINTHWHLADYPDTSLIAVPYENGVMPHVHYGYPTWPDGQLRASANDMGRFLAALLNGGELDGVRILKPETIDLMLQPQFPEADPHQAWFWFLSDVPSTAEHSGGDPGVATNIMINRELELGLILLTNSDTAEMGQVWVAIAGPIFDSADVLNGK